MRFGVESNEEITDFDNKTFAGWDQKLSARLPAFVDYNKFMSEKSQQWGKRAGLNTGNGQSEATMPLALFLSLSSPQGPFHDDPDWWKDDKKFYRFLRDHKELDGRPGKHNS